MLPRITRTSIGAHVKYIGIYSQSVIIVISLQDSYLPRLKTAKTSLSICADKNTPMF